MGKVKRALHCRLCSRRAAIFRRRFDRARRRSSNRLSRQRHSHYFQCGLKHDQGHHDALFRFRRHAHTIPRKHDYCHMPNTFLSRRRASFSKLHTLRRHARSQRWLQERGRGSSCNAFFHSFSAIRRFAERYRQNTNREFSPTAPPPRPRLYLPAIRYYTRERDMAMT